MAPAQGNQAALRDRKAVGRVFEGEPLDPDIAEPARPGSRRPAPGWRIPLRVWAGSASPGRRTWTVSPSCSHQNAPSGRAEIPVKLDLFEAPSVHEDHAAADQMPPQFFRLGHQIDAVLHDAGHAEGVVALEIEVIQAALVDLHSGRGRAGRSSLKPADGSQPVLTKREPLTTTCAAGSRFIADQMIGVRASARRIDALTVNRRHDDHALARAQNPSGLVDGQERRLSAAGIRIGPPGIPIVDVIGPGESERPLPGDELAAVGQQRSGPSALDG